MEAVGRYQAEHGVDYPCGKPEDLERVFDPEDYRLQDDGHQTFQVAIPPLPTETHIVPREVLETSDGKALLKAAIPRLPFPRVLGESDYLGGEVQLSNKACPRYHKGADHYDSSHFFSVVAGVTSRSKVPSRPCRCPAGKCWYDEQLARRGRVQRALTPEAWNALIAGTAVEFEEKPRKKKPRSLE